MRHIRSILIGFVSNSISLAAAASVEIRWMLKGKKSNLGNHEANSLEKQTIISLTSYPPRFKSLHLTLKCLLMQSEKPSKVLLWIAHEDAKQLPASVTNLCSAGLTIEYCENLRSFKKLLPALKMHPTASIATADDDVYYAKNWLSGLMIEARKGNEKEILCYRAHRILLDNQNRPLPYLEWQTDSNCSASSTIMFPTGAGGILYRPGTLSLEVLNAKHVEHCPTGDDIWFYFMGRLAGSTFRKIGQNRKLITWRGSQSHSLWSGNMNENGNDLQIRNMISTYGCVW
jgi:hypothetical protein